MADKKIKKVSGTIRSYPTILHESSADNAQNINMGNGPVMKNDTRQGIHRRMYNGSDGSSNAGRGSNH